MSFTRNFTRTDVDPNYVNAEFFKAIRLAKQNHQDFLANSQKQQNSLVSLGPKMRFKMSILEPVRVRQYESLFHS